MEIAVIVMITMQLTKLLCDYFHKEEKINMQKQIDDLKKQLNQP